MIITQTPFRMSFFGRWNRYGNFFKNMVVRFCLLRLTSTAM